MLRLVTALGAGLLVGTALTVIIPEGMHAVGKGTRLNRRIIVGNCK